MRRHPRLYGLEEKNVAWGEDWISIYTKEQDKFHNYTIEVTEKSRKENKQIIIDLIANELIGILS